MDKYISLTEQGLEAYMKALTEINWFDYKQNVEQEIRERLQSKDNTKDFVSCIYNLWFDTEGFEDDEPYNSLLDEILGIIDVKVLSKKVDYNNNNNSVNISFTTERAKYSYHIDLDEFGDWVDEDFINLFINEQVLKGENIANRFLPLPLFDQTVQFIFVPQTLYDKAVEKGIIPEDLNCFMADENE